MVVESRGGHRVYRGFMCDGSEAFLQAVGLFVGCPVAIIGAVWLVFELDWRRKQRKWK